MEALHWRGLDPVLPPAELLPHLTVLGSQDQLDPPDGHIVLLTQLLPEPIGSHPLPRDPVVIVARQLAPKLAPPGSLSLSLSGELLLHLLLELLLQSLLALLGVLL